MSRSPQTVRNTLLSSLFLALGASLYGAGKLGFELDNAIIDVNEIHRGGPPPDGIPAIDDPAFTKARRVNYLEDSDIVLGFIDGSEQRAYPLRVLIWHEIVNDTVGNLPISVVYCPLCGSAMVFERQINNQVLTFGVSGLLYNSDVLLFDRQSKSLWSQLGMQAVSGAFAGTNLKWLPSQQMTWKAWKEKYPDSKVLNLKTGHRRD